MTVESVNQDPLVQEAISSKEAVVFVNQSGFVIAGTLDGLVERLINNFSKWGLLICRVKAYLIDFARPTEGRRVPRSDSYRMRRFDRDGRSLRDAQMAFQ
jgi:hypothetical protein